MSATTGPVRDDTAVRAIMRGPLAEIDWDTSLRDAARELTSGEIGLLVVVRRRTTVGVLSERDLTGALAAGLDPDDTIALDVMTTEIVSVDAEDRVREAAEAMLEAGTRHLLVTRAGVPAGILSMRDVLDAVVVQIRLLSAQP
ncbi:cyclic nucleotide-binding/CBS domain-containing protein [Pseudonocardia spirodelae]|uniref:CBS domain-containing protein n=1 Tax=Pseudonocardia spirodelae TaxID=3133431 RepID=A0ABU8T2H6_9PSEU